MGFGILFAAATAVAMSVSAPGGGSTSLVAENVAARCRRGEIAACVETKLRQATILLSQDRPVEAEALSRDALRLAIRHRRSLDEANAVSDLAASLRMQGRPAQAERYNRRSVALSIRLLGAEATDTAIAYTNLAVNLDALARYGEAEQLHRHAVAIGSMQLGGDDPQTALYADNLAQNLAFQGRYEEARALHQRALSVRQRRLGDALPTAVSLTGLAGDLDALGLTEQAEPLWRQVGTIRETLSGTTVPGVANALHNLATNLIRQDRASEAEPLFVRAMAIYAATGASFDRAVVEVGWAKALVDTGRPAEGEAAYRDALAVLRTRLPPGHPRITDAMTGIALSLAGRGQTRAALAMLNDVLQLDEATLGRNHPELASSSTLVGRALMERGDTLAAAPLLERAVTVAKASLPPDHPTRILAETALAKLLYATLGADRSRADALLRDAMAGADARIARRTGFDRAAQRDRRDLAEPFDLRIDANWLIAIQAGEVDPNRCNEAFVAAQRADVSGVAAAVVGNGPLAAAMRHRDALAVSRDVADRRETEALAIPHADRAALAVARRTIEAELAKADADLARLDPRRSALRRIAPVAVDAIRSRLASDEAMLYVRTVADASHVWLVTRDGARWWREPSLARGELTTLIGRLRAGLGVGDARSQIGTTPSRPFDRNAAQELYQRLIAPFAGDIGARRRLLFATSGPLAALPLGLLMDEQGRWLADRLAITALPAPGVLVTLRCGGAECHPHERPASAIDVLAVSDAAELSQTTGQRWRMALPALAAAEVQAVAAIFVSKVRTIPADEASFRADPDLAAARYVLIATHGLAAGPGGESGLVFAPAQASAGDGFLSASEAASLRLSADLVVLSACDTAASDGTPDGDAFSGLVRSFLIAGARSVLASQWRVSDTATAALMTAFFTRLRAGAAPADAIQGAMVEVRDTPGGRWADPRYWAGFTLIGDGR